MQRQPILVERRQWILDVCQGPDGLLDVPTDEAPGTLLSIEPAP